MKKSNRRKGKRPQPGGWSEAVQRRLRPEHVERISDTQVKITLPPCPDFDLEEDEVVDVWIPATALKNAKEPIYGGSFTIKADTYVERIQHAIQGLNEERDALPEHAKLPHFLLTFFACEIIAKSVVSMHKNKGRNTKALSSRWNTKEISSALQDLGIQASSAKIEQLFSTAKAFASEMSARSLRDNVVHRLKGPHREAVRNRYDELMPIMQDFVKSVETWIKIANVT